MRRTVLALAWLTLASTACNFPVFLPEFVVNTSGPGYSESEDVALGKYGDFIVAWSEFPTNDGEALARRFNRLCTPLDDPFPVNSGTTDDQRAASIARDAQGRFVAVWADEATTIRGRRFDADGTALGGDFPVNTSTPVHAVTPHVASDPSGNFVVTWTSYDATSADVLARRFDSNGVPLGDEFTVNVFTSGVQTAGGVAMSPAGFVVAWGGAGSGAPNGIFARLFDADGNSVTSDLDVHDAPLVSANLRRPDVAMNRDGDFVVVWDDEGASGHVVIGRRWNFTGTPAAESFPISEATADDYDPRVASDSAGNFLVTWTRSVDDPAASDAPSAAAGTLGLSIAARLFIFGGLPTSDPFQINDAAGTNQHYRSRPSLADDGSFVVAWTRGADDEFEVRGRKTAVRAARAIDVDPIQSLTSSPAGGSLNNGVFEPGETQTVGTAWVNDGNFNLEDFTGTSWLFTGPEGADYTVNADAADYGTIPVDLTRSCVLQGVCPSVTVSNPAVRPLQHWDASLHEIVSISVPHTWVLHLGESFPDVPTGNQFYRFVETLFHNGVTGGCAGGVNYCPTNPVTRAQMAVFLLKAKFGSAHIPPPCTGTVFPDVPCTGGPFDPWIEELAALEITGGCGGGLYCPNNTVTRQQMAVFLLKAQEGSAYVPANCAGVFDDVPCTPGTGFPDWIEELANRAITGGCSVTPPLYCPTNPNNRGQMAAFIVKTFGLALYGG
jgi:hypothetical protein